MNPMYKTENDDLDMRAVTVVRVLSRTGVTEYRQKILNVMMEVRTTK